MNPQYVLESDYPLSSDVILRLKASFAEGINRGSLLVLEPGFHLRTVDGSRWLSPMSRVLAAEGVGL